MSIFSAIKSIKIKKVIEKNGDTIGSYYITKTDKNLLRVDVKFDKTENCKKIWIHEAAAVVSGTGTKVWKYRTYEYSTTEYEKNLVTGRYPYEWVKF